MIRSVFLRATVWIFLLVLGIPCFVSAEDPAASKLPDPIVESRKESMPLLGDYGGEIRETRPRKDGLRHVDTPRMIRKLKEMGVNTYFYLIWHQPSDWDDLRKEFLPAAKKAGIDVWVYLVPPSEARKLQSEPYGTDYVAWFRAVGQLSGVYNNLRGIVMDDFNHNLRFFTPDYVRKMRLAGREANPRFQFVPQIYFDGIRHETIRTYRPYIDGVLMTFRDGKYRNTQRIDHLPRQIDQVHRMLKKERLPFYLMIHASKLSATPANPSVDYVLETLRIGLDWLKQDQLDGVVTYVMHKEWFPEKRDRVAISGDGYACLFVPPGLEPLPGGMGEFRQTIHPDDSGKYLLSFSHIDVHPYNLVSGQYVKQVAVDDTVVWQRDVTLGPREKWKRQQVDLTPHLRGKKQAVLSLRLLRINRGSSAWLYTGFDHLRPRGFSLRDADFEKGTAWTYRANHPAVIGENILYDPNRQLRVYLIATRLYTAYDIFYHALQSDPVVAEAGDRLLTTMIRNQPRLALVELEQMIGMLQQNPSLDPDLGIHLMLQGKKLRNLLMIDY